MHAITSNTSCIAVGGAGRRHKHLAHVTQDTDMPVASQSPVQKSDADARRCGRKERSFAVAMISQWKARIARIARKIPLSLSREKVPGAEAEHMKLLHHAICLIAYHEENEKARLEFKASVADYCTSEDFDQMFPPSLRYISKEWDQQFANEAWAGLVSARK